MRPGPLHTLNAILSAAVAAVILGGAAWTIIRPSLVLAEDLEPITKAILEQGKVIDAQGASLRTIERYVLLVQIDSLTVDIAALTFKRTNNSDLWNQDDQLELSKRTTERTRAETSLAAMD